jgi:hypothetical protein
VNIIYLPDSGIVWAGGVAFGARIVLLEEQILGFWYQSGGHDRLIVASSTNRYGANLKNLAPVLEAELTAHKAIRGPSGGYPACIVSIEPILGSATMRDKVLPSMAGVDEYSTHSMVARPSRLREVSVEGTNVVVAIEIGTNILAKIAFDKNVRPTWATTNGVSIGCIPTNTVISIDMKPDGHREKKVVY